MDISNHLKSILNGEAILLMGSGASFGAKNALGLSFPSGFLLAESLYRECGEAPTPDLQDASQLYIEKHSDVELINKIRSELSVASVASWHEVIYSQPWMRIYTTNYDNVGFISAKRKGKNIVPVTLSSNFKKYIKEKNVCVHINGHIDNLNEDTIHNEFKLTSSSYSSYENIDRSQWGALLRNELEAAESIIVMGLSLEYDLDLRRIIYNANIRNKVLIIDKIDLDATGKRKLARHGEIYPGGLKEFAEDISSLSTSYIPPRRDPASYIYHNFKHEYKKTPPILEPTGEDIFNFYINGLTPESMFHKYDGEYTHIVRRKCLDDLIDGIESKKKIIFLHSNFGNGKTTIVNTLKAELSNKDIHFFELTNVNPVSIKKEISNICSMQERRVVIIDDFFNTQSVTTDFSNSDITDITFVLLARTSMYYAKSYDICVDFKIKDNESIAIDANSLRHDEIVKCIDILSLNGLLGEAASLSRKEKIKKFKDKKSINSTFQSISLEVLKSNSIKNKIDSIVKSIKDRSNVYYDTTLLILLVKVLGLNLSIDDVKHIMGVDSIMDINFQKNHAINELIDFNSEVHSFKIKSTIVAKYIVERINSLSDVISLIVKVANYSAKYYDTEKFNSILRNIISFSHINTVTKNFSERDKFIINYYDELSKIDFYNRNHFFWLQYSISCLEIGDLGRSQQYIEHSYGLSKIDPRFVPFQINNQQARIFLEKISTGKSSDMLDDFKKAHDLLMLPITSRKDNEEHVVKIFGHYVRSNFRGKFKTDAERAQYKDFCSSAYNRVSGYLKNSSSDKQGQYKDLAKALFQAGTS